MDDPGAAAREALTAVGLSESGDHLVDELSGGQQQRVAIARALALRPRLLLGDPPTTDLDPDNRARVLKLLRDLSDTGTTVLLASDDPAIAADCDRVIALSPRRVVSNDDLLRGTRARTGLRCRRRG